VYQQRLEMQRLEFFQTCRQYVSPAKGWGMLRLEGLLWCAPLSVWLALTLGPGTAMLNRRR
jgi:hypothetical protein